ncbi:hypothetical protein GW17_00060643, partial [Ensete ventricosum]
TLTLALSLTAPPREGVVALGRQPMWAASAALHGRCPYRRSVSALAASPLVVAPCGLVASGTVVLSISDSPYGWRRWPRVA